MEHVHSIILIKRGDKYLNYFDERWGMYLFPNIKGNDIEEIKNKYNTNNVKYLFDKVHEKYSIPNKEKRILIDRYLMGKTQVEISEEIGISQAQVSRLEKNAIKDVKKLIK